MAYLIGKNLTTYSLNSWSYRWWKLFFIILISGSIFSCAISSQSEVWYNKDHDNEHIVIAKIINQVNFPLLLSDTQTPHLLSLSHLLKPTVQIWIRPSCATCQIPTAEGFRLNLSTVEGLEKFSDVFLYHYHPSDAWLKELGKQQNYKFERLVFGFAEWSKDRPVLWRVTHKR